MLLGLGGGVLRGRGLFDVLLLLEGVPCGATWVATANEENRLLGDATARNAGAAQVRDVAGNPAGVELVVAADASPAKVIVIIVTALHGQTAALQMKQDASQFLRGNRGSEGVDK